MKQMVRNCTLFLAAAAAFFALPGTVEANSIGAEINETLVIGDQVFEGGKLELTSVSTGSLFALVLNDRPIALLHRSSCRAMRGDGHPAFTFERDQRGYHRLIGLKASPADEVQEFAYATIAKGEQRGDARRSGLTPVRRVHR